MKSLEVRKTAYAAWIQWRAHIENSSYPSFLVFSPLYPLTSSLSQAGRKRITVNRVLRARGK